MHTMLMTERTHLQYLQSVVAGLHPASREAGKLIEAALDEPSSAAAHLHAFHGAPDRLSLMCLRPDRKGRRDARCACWCNQHSASKISQTAAPARPGSSSPAASRLRLQRAGGESLALSRSAGAPKRCL